MDLTEDSPCIIGSACRLPGGILRTDSLWTVFNKGEWEASSTLPPTSRGFASFFQTLPPPFSLSGRGGWLGEEGIERFDPQFFGISVSEATSLRPNVRLGLELTYEALENAGIPPSSLGGKNISVSVGVGTEDGWDVKRWKDDGPNAFDHHWAASSDPSGVSGRIAHIFDFQGSCNTVSNACASGAFALRDGVNSLYQEDAEVAIVGSLATHFCPAPFGWAITTGVASHSGRCASFSPDADGYSPSEGAVFFVLKRLSAARSSGDPIHAIIRSIASGHNGSTRTFITPNPQAQITLNRKALAAARLNPADVTLLEAHGTGTPVGDALEAEGIWSTFGTRKGQPLLLSSSKTVLGHCHGAAALVGILKVMSCFSHHLVPPHHVTPLSEFITGSIIIPTKLTPLESDIVIGQVNAFGFTGSIASIVLEQPPQPPDFPRPSSSLPSSPEAPRYLLPFSAKSSTALSSQIHAVCSWALKSQCSLHDLAAVLGLCRDHHSYRRAIVASTLNDLVKYCGDLPLQTEYSTSENWGSSEFSRPEERITMALLDLSNLDGQAVEDGFNQARLQDLLEQNRILDAACLLYEGGHNLSFSSIYDKHDIDVAVLTSFPLYRFDRQRYWKDPSASLSVPRTQPESRTVSSSHGRSNVGAAPSNNRFIPKSDTSGNLSSISQEEFEQLLQTFGAPIDMEFIEKPVAEVSSSHILITGANGMLGVQLLSRLLLMPSISAYCIVRGDPWSRLCNSFKKHQLDIELLHDARARGSLHLLPTKDLCGPKLGVSDVDYNTLLESVDSIVHSAWNVNFNLPLVEFLPLLQCTRALAELSSAAKKLVKYYFIGSYASTFNYGGKLVPETPRDPQVSDSLDQGYAISKLVAEHSLLRIHHFCTTSFQLTIVRVGQICGDTVTGSWSQDEMMPMMIASLTTLRALPLFFPDVSWIPSDICADALRDIVIAPRVTEAVTCPHIIHLANPHIIPWHEAAKRIGELAGIGSPSFLSLQDYVELIRRQETLLPVARLLPYFVSSLETGTMPQRYASLEVSESLKFSSSLASCPPIDSKLLELIVRSVLKPFIPTPPAERSSPVFIFGPWSTFSSIAEIPLSNAIEERVMESSASIKASLDYPADIDELVPPLSCHALNPTDKIYSKMLEQQLKTLASQLTVVQRLSDHGIYPRAVLGYCFGEYAAAVTSGILPEKTVVEIIIRRAIALRDVEGAMLNVFAEVSLVRRSLASISSPPSIAIFAGPKHVLISGTYSQVKCAEAELHRHGAKTLLIHGTPPFHCPVMDVAATKFAPFSFLPQNSNITYISGMTGGILPGLSLGPNYWLRHMREPVEFYRSMQAVRAGFAGESIVDVGPDVTLTKIVNRYEWPDISVISPKEAAALGGGIITGFAKSSAPRQPREVTISLLSGSSQAASNPLEIASELLKELFGYDLSSELLSRSPHSIGLQSLDFIRFANHFGEHTGIHVALSAFVSDAPFEKIICDAECGVSVR